MANFSKFPVCTLKNVCSLVWGRSVLHMSIRSYFLIVYFNLLYPYLLFTYWDRVHIKLILLKCTVQWFFQYINKTVQWFWNETFPISPSSGLWQPLNLPPVSLDFPLLDISYNWNHIIDGLFHPAALFSMVFPCRSTYQDFITLSGQINSPLYRHTTSCLCIHPWWTLGCYFHLWVLWTMLL